MWMLRIMKTQGLSAVAAAFAVARVVSVAAVTPLGRPSVAATATVVVAAWMLDGRLLPRARLACNVSLGRRTSTEALLLHATHTLCAVGTSVPPRGVDARGCVDATGRRYNAIKSLLVFTSHRSLGGYRRHILQQPK